MTRYERYERKAIRVIDRTLDRALYRWEGLSHDERQFALLVALIVLCFALGGIL